ncbi:MAG: ribosome recycling factor [Chloroflexota bacterium]
MINPTLLNTEKKMKASIEGLKTDLSTIRTGRASPALVAHLRVDYAGVPTPLNQMAGISAPEARLIVIQPWDKSTLREIEKTILKSELGLNPLSDGNVIRLAIPPLSEERRQELVRLVRRKLEERKVIIRNLRQDGMKEIRQQEKDKEVSQDVAKRTQEQLQKLTDAIIAEVDRVGKDKEMELSEV